MVRTMATEHVVAHIRLPRALRARLKVLAARRETSLRRLATEAFEALLDSENEPAGRGEQAVPRNERSSSA